MVAIATATGAALEIPSQLHVVTSLEREERIQLKNSIQLANGSLLKSKLKLLAIYNYFNRIECYAPHDVYSILTESLSLDCECFCACVGFLLLFRWPKIFVSLARSGNDLRLFIRIIQKYKKKCCPHFTQLRNM